MLRRIKNLGEVQQHILGLAAVVGYEFEYEFVSRLFSRTNNYREEMIEELIQLQFFRKSDQGKLHFYSGRVRDLIYEEMGKFNRKMFHERVAEELEKVNQTDSAKWPELAYHYARTGNLTKAIHYMNPGEPLGETSVRTLNKLTKNDEVQQR
jgi:predicted ATPase